MPHETDYGDAHRRHWEDAELLSKNERFANADHLYGMSAECGLKRMMQSLGMPVGPKGLEDRRYLKHLPDLWPIFITFVKDRGSTRYIREWPKGNPFDQWSINDRYANRQYCDEWIVEQHRNAALTIQDVLDRLRMDGIS